MKIDTSKPDQIISESDDYKYTFLAQSSQGEIFGEFETLSSGDINYSVHNENGERFNYESGIGITMKPETRTFTRSIHYWDLPSSHQSFATTKSCGGKVEYTETLMNGKWVLTDCEVVE